MPEPRRRIAVVEDDAQIRDLVEKTLTSGGYEVVSTGDPTAALALVRNERPDLVLCDIAMPVLDGYGVLKALQSNPDTVTVPVIFLTAHHEFSERVRAFRFGVVDYVTKPFTRQILLRKLEKIFESLRERSGVVTAEGASAGEILEEMRRESRTGVLTVQGDGGESRLFLRAGEVIHATGDAPALGSPLAQFEELDAAREDILSHDPPTLPASPNMLPSFDDIPEVLRQVLVVDDNRVFRAFLKNVLGAQGFTVHEATSADEGLRLALEKRPWLILTDIRMPGESGFELCRKVRSHSLIRQTPLLFLSGFDDYKARHLSLELGADDFLSKETSVRELLIRIQVILKRYLALGRTPRAAAMEGNLQVMGAPGVLQVCHLTRLSGTLGVESGPRHLDIRFRDGEIVGAAGEGVDGAEAVYELLGWEHGHFRFTPGEVPPADAGLGLSFSQLVLEGCRQLDELRQRGAGAAGD